MEFDEMKDRIAHIIRAKNLTATEFATQLGIQPSNVSHLLAGRNNPSLDFVKKLKDTFPEYSLDWIVMGKGPMTVSEPFFEPSSNMFLGHAHIQHEGDGKEITDGTLFASEPVVPSASDSCKTEDAPVLERIVMVYSDNSFEVLLPK